MTRSKDVGNRSSRRANSNGGPYRSVEQPTLFDDFLEPRAGNTHLTTLYRLRVTASTEGLHDALNGPYLQENGFEVSIQQVAEAPALLVQGTVPRPRAAWCDPLSSLTNSDVELGYSNGGAALLVALDGQAYALTYGTLGQFMIDRKVQDPTFGVSFAVRALLADEIRHVRRRMIGILGRVDRSFVPGGQPIRMYGIDQWGEIVGQVSGLAHNPNLTVCRRTKKPTKVEGSEALRIDLSTDPSGMLADLREVDRVCRQDSPLADLEFITQIRPIPPSDPRIAELADVLDKRLATANPLGIGLAVPGELISEIENVQSYQIQVPKSGLRSTLIPDLDLGAILSHTHNNLEGERWRNLQNGRLTIYADKAGSEEITSTPISRWVTAEVPAGGSQLLLHEGAWYEIGDQHRQFLRKEISQILHKSSTITLPPWTPNIPDEDAYNRSAAAHDPSLVLLDKKLLRIAQHRRGIEACDLLGPNNELIHVKRASGSSPLSHLFAQGTTSADALRYEPDARKSLAQLVRKQPNGRRISKDFRPRKVIFAIALTSGREVTVDTLFSFAQVALYRAVKTLRNEGVDVEVIAIPAA